MLAGRVALLLAAAAAVSTVSSQDVSVTFLEFPPSYMMVDHKCRHGAAQASVRLQIVPDTSVSSADVSSAVEWKVLGLDKDAGAYQSEPDACNVAPGPYRALFRSTKPDSVAVSTTQQNFKVKPGSTTVLWLRVKKPITAAVKRMALFNQAVDAPVDGGQSKWHAAVSDYEQALVIEAAQKKCETKNGGCASEATCLVSRKGKQSCACNAGYSGDGAVCAEMKNCGNIDLKCPTNSICRMVSEQDGSCFCKTGYYGFDNSTNPICHPINPCHTAGRGNCSKHAFCEMIAPNKAKCACNYGYVGTGYRCKGVIAIPANATAAAPKLSRKDQMETGREKSLSEEEIDEGMMFASKTLQ